MQNVKIWKIWCIDVPSLAFQNEPSNPLADLLLANSALHLQSVNPNDRSITLASSYYLESGLVKFKNAILHLDEQNSPTLFASSILVVLYVLCSRQQELILNREYSPPSAWFRALQGTKSIVAMAREWIRKSSLEALLLDDQTLVSHSWPLSDDSPFDELLIALSTETLKPERISAYKIAVIHLSRAYALQLAGGDRRAVFQLIMSFPVVVPAIIVDLLQSHDPRTLVIIAYFFGLITFVDDVWWLQGVARREIFGLLSIIPEEWKWIMQWPLQQTQRLSQSLLASPNS
jgi:hypothetical protein